MRTTRFLFVLVLLVLAVPGCGDRGAEKAGPGEPPVAPGQPPQAEPQPPQPASSVHALLGDATELLVADAAVDLQGLVDRVLSASREGPAGAIVVDYPFDGTIFPPEIVAPTVLWHDEAEDVDTWIVEVVFESGGEPVRVLTRGPAAPQGPIDPEALGPTNEVYRPTAYQATAHSWRPARAVWEEIKRRSVEAPARFVIRGFASGEATAVRSEGGNGFTTSTDAVEAPIFYRDVPLMPGIGEGGRIQPLRKNAIPMIGWRLRDIGREESRLVLTGMPSCANCHSFSNDGAVLGMDVDGPHGDKGAYAVAPVEEELVIDDSKVITWNSFPDKIEDHKTIGFLSRVSPDGRYVVSTVNEALYVVNFEDFRFLQVFYPTRGILAVHDSETGTMQALSGGDDQDFVHCNAVFSPDGKTLVFARARAQDPYAYEQPARANAPEELPVLFDLYRMPFNEGRGGTPVALAGASENGMSNTYPKVSPDGKWVVFVKSRNGMLMRPDGKLWIVPLAGGEAREMECNLPLMNSWHSFSPNGRWLIWSSKSFTPYTQMFITHLDEEGNSSPAVLIPNSTAANRAVNLPEFMNADYDALQTIRVPAVNHHRYFQTGAEKLEGGDFRGALADFRQAIEADPTFARALASAGQCLKQLGRRDEAIESYEKAVAADPQSPVNRTTLAVMLSEGGRLPEAVEHLKRTIEISPRYFLAYKNLAIAYRMQGEAQAAVDMFRQALKVAPESPHTRRQLVDTLLRADRQAEALAELEKLAEYEPEDTRARTILAWHLATSADPGIRDAEKAIRYGEEAVAGTSRRDGRALDALAAAYAEAGRFDEALRASEEALRVAGEDPQLAETIRAHAESYAAGEPIRQP